MKFTKIPKSTFDAMQFDAGLLLSTFDPESGAEPADGDILCATTGDVTITCKPSYVDMGEDVNNCPEGMAELKKLTGWECTLKFTSLSFAPAMLKLGLGAADVDGSKVTIRRSLSIDDFGDIWWVGDAGEDDLVAVHVLNALSTEGVTITAAKNSKGRVEMTLQGHVSIDAQDAMPMEFYSTAGTEAA